MIAVRYLILTAYYMVFPPRKQLVSGLDEFDNDVMKEWEPEDLRTMGYVRNHLP